MILNHNTLDLFGKKLFETVTLIPPYIATNNMQNEACFLHVIEGEYDSISETERLIIEAEDSVLMRCGNYIAKMIGTKTSKKHQALAIHFDSEVLLKIYQNELPSFLKMPNTSSVGMTRINSDVLIKKYIESILFYFENPNLVNEDIIILKMKEIILLLNQTENAPKIKAILSNLFNPKSYSLREVIEAHIFSNLTLEELAGLCNLSLSTFKREFKKAFKIAPATYIRNKKLQKAIQLIEVTDLRTTEIAYECGFSDVSHFSRTFKHKFGESPSHYKLTHFHKTLD